MAGRSELIKALTEQFTQITLTLKTQAALKAKLVSTHYWSDVAN